MSQSLIRNLAFVSIPKNTGSENLYRPNMLMVPTCNRLIYFGNKSDLGEVPADFLSRDYIHLKIKKEREVNTDLKRLELGQKAYQALLGVFTGMESNLIGNALQRKVADTLKKYDPKDSQNLQFTNDIYLLAAVDKDFIKKEFSSKLVRVTGFVTTDALQMLQPVNRDRALYISSGNIKFDHGSILALTHKFNKVIVISKDGVIPSKKEINDYSKITQGRNSRCTLEFPSSTADVLSNRVGYVFDASGNKKDNEQTRLKVELIKRNPDMAVALLRGYKTRQQAMYSNIFDKNDILAYSKKAFESNMVIAEQASREIEAIAKKRLIGQDPDVPDKGRGGWGSIFGK
jgi:hypothetical protein